MPKPGSEMSGHKSTASAPAALLTAALLCVIAAAPGQICCGPQMGALIYWSGVVPHQKIKPEFVLTNGPVAVLIDDPLGLVPDSTLLEELHRALADELTTSRAASQVIPPQRLRRLERSEPDFQKLSVRQIGERLGARQVVYVSILTFTLGPEASLGVLEPRARAAVKVCSTEPKRHVRLWPTEQTGRIVEVRLPTAQAMDEQQRKRCASRLCRALARRIAMLFYEHPAEEEKALETGRRPPL